MLTAMIDLFLIWQMLLAFEIILFLSYTALMYKFSKKENTQVVMEHTPTVTLIIPMYNEEKVIKEKIQNTSLLNYPKEKLEVILLDDHSTDNSKSISQKAIKDYSLNARVVPNQGGKGKARALNWIFPSIENEITLISDADALLEKDSLQNIVKNFNSPEIGGATGKIVIISDKDRASKSQEDSYRFYFDIWRLGESNIESVSVCNGPIMAFRTELLKKVKINPDIYADDSDLLFRMIKIGYRVIYEPKAIVYERVPLSIKGRTIQKMKRINGLRKVYLTNLDLIGKGKFGQIIYPYALLTHIVSPIIILIMTIMYPLIVYYNYFYAAFLILLLIPKIGNTLFSFVLTQLIMNFSFVVPTGGSWEAVEDARYELDSF